MLQHHSMQTEEKEEGTKIKYRNMIFLFYAREAYRNRYFIFHVQDALSSGSFL